MTSSDLKQALQPILEEIEKRSAIADAFVDKDTYMLYLATFWANLVMNPEEAGLAEDHIEPAHDVINDIARNIVGEDAVAESFRFINSKSGEVAMEKSKISKTHRELLGYFASMILDPEGHKKWMEDVRDR